jgi:hypothetical protein
MQVQSGVMEAPDPVLAHDGLVKPAQIFDLHKGVLEGLLCMLIVACLFLVE